MGDGLWPWLVRRRSLVAGVLVAITVVGFALAPRMRADFSVQSFFRPGEPEYDRYGEHVARWGADDRDVWVVLHDDARALDDPGTRTELRALERTLAALPKVREVQNPLGSSELADAGPSPPFLSEDRHTGAMVVRLGIPTMNPDALKDVIPALKDALSSWSSRTGIAADATGLPFLRFEFVEAAIEDQTRLFPLVMLLVLAILVGVFRRPREVALPALAALLPVVWLVGVMSATQEPVGLLNQVIFTLIPAIAVADGIHIALAAREHEPNAKGVVATMRTMMGACAATSLTTAIGFASLATTGVELLVRFGVYAAVGVLLAFFAAMLLGASLLRTAPSPKPLPEVAPRVVDAIARLALGAPRALIAAALVISVVAGYGAYRLPIDFHLTDMLAKDHPTTVASGRVNAHLAGTANLEVEIDGDLKDDAVWKNMDTLARALEATPGVRYVDGPLARLAITQRSLGVPEELPASVEAREQFLLLAESAGIDSVLDAERRHARMVVAFPDLGASSTLPMMAELAKVVERSELDARTTGIWLVAYRSVMDVLEGLRESVLLVFAMIALAALVAFRSVLMALVVAWANLLPLAIAAAVLNAFGFTVDLGVVVAMSVGLGIAVDDTVHLAHRYRLALKAGAGPKDAIERALRHAGAAVVLTTVLLVLGFGAHAWSGFPATRVIGITGALVIGSALLADLFVLVPCLSLMTPAFAKGHPSDDASTRTTRSS